PDSVSVTVPTDLAHDAMTPDQALGLFTLYVQGGLDLDTYIYHLDRGQFLRPGDAPEDVIERLQAGVSERQLRAPGGERGEDEDEDDEDDDEKDDDEDEEDDDGEDGTGARRPVTVGGGRNGRR